MRKILLVAMWMLFCSSSLLVFPQSVKSRTSIESIVAPIEMTVADSNRLVVKNAPIGQKLEIFSIIGAKVRVIEMKSSYGEYTLNLPKSFYVFRLAGKVEKFVVR